MIIEIDSDYLENKTEEEISKIIIDILKGNLTYPGIIIQGNKKNGENYPCLTEDIKEEDFYKMFSVENAMNILKNALSGDKSMGSYYFSWKKNFAKTIYANTNLTMYQCGLIAEQMLDDIINII